MGYRPPSSRMRSIRAEKPPRPTMGDPANIEEALAEEALSTEATPSAEAPLEEALAEEAPVVEESLSEEPAYGPKSKKSDLIELATRLGILVDEEMTKSQILEKLDAQ